MSLMRLANLTRMKHKKVSADSDSDDESSSEEDEDEDEDGMGGPAGAVKPSMQAQSVAHHGGVNRIRCMPQKPQMCATWGDTGRVQVSTTVLTRLILQYSIRQCSGTGTVRRSGSGPIICVTSNATTSVTLRFVGSGVRGSSSEVLWL